MKGQVPGMRNPGGQELGRTVREMAMGRSLQGQRAVNLKAAVKAANAALKAAAKGPGGWSAKASARPSPRGPLLEVSWTCRGPAGKVEGSAEWRLADLVQGRAHA
jgi:hypothetical protein